jgi:periplasmic protein TonB
MGRAMAEALEAPAAVAWVRGRDPGVGRGSGGGIGGGVYKLGGGISAPRVVYAPDPEYSEEARREKYQGTLVLWLIVGSDGRPGEIHVARSLGMGLDDKAIEAVKIWLLRTGTKGRKTSSRTN